MIFDKTLFKILKMTIINTSTSNPFRTSMKNTYNTIQQPNKFNQATGSFTNIKRFLESEVTINEDTCILYTSCINYVRGSLFTELSPKYTTMFDNMNGNLKFNYIGTGTNLKNLFNSYDLEYEEL